MNTREKSCKAYAEWKHFIESYLRNNNIIADLNPRIFLRVVEKHIDDEKIKELSIKAMLLYDYCQYEDVLIDKYVANIYIKQIEDYLGVK